MSIFNSILNSWYRDLYQISVPLLITVSMISHVSCDDRPARVWSPPPRPMPVIYDMGAGTDLDLGSGGGIAGESIDPAGIEVGGMAGALGGTAGSEQLDLNVEDAPPAQQVTMITSSEQIWIVWRHGNELRLSSFPITEVAQISTEGMLLKAKSQSIPLTFKFNPQDVEDALDLTLDELVLQGVYAQRPWLILSHPLLPSSLLLDLSDLESSPQFTDLSGPITVATHGAILWLIGRLPQSDLETDTVAWRWWNGESLGPRHQDRLGLSLPVHATYALGQWILSTQDGQCLTASRRNPDLEGTAWHCQSVSKSRIWGNPDQFTLIGPLPRVADNQRSGMWSWIGVPGFTGDPLYDAPNSNLTFISPHQAWSWHGEGLLWSNEFENNRYAWTVRRWVDSDTPSTINAGEDGTGGGLAGAETSAGIEEAGADIVEAGAGASTVAGAEAGARGGEDHESTAGEHGGSLQGGISDAGSSVVMDPSSTEPLKEHQVLRASLTSISPTISVVDLGPQPLVFTWDLGQGVPKLMLGEPWEAVHELAQSHHDSCLLEVERCDELDHDCDGSPNNGLCCQEGDVNAALLNGVISADRNWLTAESELGLLIAVASSNRADLFTAAYTGGDAQLRGTWPNIQRLELIGNLYSLVVLAGRNANDESILLWNLNTEGSYVQLPAPCEPLALTIIDQSFKTRVICANQVFEVDPHLGQVTQVTAPEEGERLWVTRWHPQGLLADEVYYVVAIGETAQLSLWREGREEGLTLANESELILPNLLGQMDPSERLNPFLPPTVEGGWPARINQRKLEVWSPLVGWVNALNTRWPLTASLSSFSPLAVSVSYTEDPTSVGDSFLQRVTIFTHHLGRAADFWGKPFKVSISKDSFAGAHPAGYDDIDGLRPNLMTLIGNGLEMNHFNCHP